MTHRKYYEGVGAADRITPAWQSSMPPEKLMRQRKVVTSIQPARSTDFHAETIQATSESSMVVSEMVREQPRASESSVEAATPDRKLGLCILPRCIRRHSGAHMCVV